MPVSGFSQQVEEFKKQLSFLADQGVEVNDDEGTPTRSTSYYVEIPDPKTGIMTTFDYREEFQRVDHGWLRSRYFYELRFSAPNTAEQHSRRAHHEHAPWAVHQHCQTPTRPDDHHYADVERLLQATHETFVRQFLSASAVDCSGLVRLDRPRGTRVPATKDLRVRLPKMSPKDVAGTRRSPAGLAT